MSGHSSEDICRTSGVNYRRIDYWCRIGLFGPDQQDLGSGRRRRFTDDDVRFATILGRVSDALSTNSQRHQGGTLFQHLAPRIRRGGTATVQLAPGVWLTIDPNPESPAHLTADDVETLLRQAVS